MVPKDQIIPNPKSWKTSLEAWCLQLKMWWTNWSPHLWIMPFLWWIALQLEVSYNCNIQCCQLVFLMWHTSKLCRIELNFYVWIKSFGNTVKNTDWRRSVSIWCMHTVRAPHFLAVCAPQCAIFKFSQHSVEKTEFHLNILGVLFHSVHTVHYQLTKVNAGTACCVNRKLWKIRCTFCEWRSEA